MRGGRRIRKKSRRLDETDEVNFCRYLTTCTYLCQNLDYTMSEQAKYGCTWRLAMTGKLSVQVEPLRPRDVLGSQ